MATHTFTLLAAVDISHGATSLLRKGHVVTKEEFGDPVRDAQSWVEQGAQWIHLEDLDSELGSLGDKAGNRKVMEKVAHAVKGRAHIEVAGGITTDDDIAWAKRLGAQRVIIDLASSSDWREKVYRDLGHRCAVMLMVHNKRVFAPGSDLHGQDAVQVAADLAVAGCPGLMVTDVDREGTRRGPHKDLVLEIAAAARIPIVVAGGIGTLEHIHALSTAGRDVCGAVMDAALLEDYFSVAEAVAAVEPRFDPYQWGPALPWGMTQGLY